jgi:hypothetical protein
MHGWIACWDVRYEGLRGLDEKAGNMNGERMNVMNEKVSRAS